MKQEIIQTTVTFLCRYECEILILYNCLLRNVTLPHPYFRWQVQQAEKAVANSNLRNHTGVKSCWNIRRNKVLTIKTSINSPLLQQRSLSMFVPIQRRPVESSSMPAGHWHVKEPSVLIHLPPPRHRPGYRSHSFTSEIWWTPNFDQTLY